MKKKLAIKDLKVQSFITTPDATTIKGGEESRLCMTNQSCYDYISCNHWQCIAASKADPCWRDVVETSPAICQ